MDLHRFYKGKTVFVTGHTGFKGSWLSLLLHQLGAKVVGYALPAPTHPSLYEIAGIEQLVTSYIGDVRNYHELSGILKRTEPDVVIHMAAQPLVRESYKNPVDTYSINVMGTVNLLEATRHLENVRAVLNVTTDKCYENKEWYWGYRENEPMGGYDPYSNSKACSELVTSSFRNSFFNIAGYGSSHHVAVATARAGNVIGGGDWAEDRLIPDFVRSVLQHKEIIIRNPGAIRPWQHVLEPLSGYLTLCAKMYDEGPAYAEGWNFGPEDNDAQNVEWIIKTMCRLWDEKLCYKTDAYPQPHEAGYLKLDCSKAKTLLDWRPKWDIRKTLESIVEWTKEYQQGKNMYDTCIRQINQYFSSIG